MPVARAAKKRKAGELFYSCKTLLWPDYCENSEKKLKIDENGNQDASCVTFSNGLTVSTECNTFTGDEFDLESLSDYSADTDELAVSNQNPETETARKSLLGTLFSPVLSFFTTSTQKEVTDATLKSYIIKSIDTPPPSENDVESEDSNAIAGEESYTRIAQLSPYSPVSLVTSVSSNGTHSEDQKGTDPFYLVKNIPSQPTNVKKTVLPLPTRRTPKMCLVLDLDETLVHCSFSELQNYDKTFQVPYENETYTIYMSIRPYLFEFLEEVSKIYEVILFTASSRVYASKLLDLLDPKREIFRHRLYREHCDYVQGTYVKDLSILGRDLRSTMIIDNSPQSFAYQISNGIPIESWYVDKNDVELRELIPFLQKLAEVKDDVRPHIRDRYRLHELLSH